MSDPVTQRSRARFDLLAQFVYFGEQADASCTPHGIFRNFSEAKKLDSDILVDPAT